MVLSLDHASLEELNDYFGELWSENTYMEPAPIELGEDHVIPEITKRQAWNSLQQVSKTATGPDRIPYTVCGRTTPNFSLQSLPWFGIFLSRLTRGLDLEKKSNVIPLPKVDILKEKTDYQGKNVTSVIARAFD